MNSNHKILSIDGGGIRGVVALAQLVKVESMSGQVSHKFYDLVAGTSTGGIVAVLMSIGYSAQEVLEFYTTYGEEIFNKPPLRWGIFKPRYNEDNFEKLIRRYVGDKTLLDCKVDIVVPAYNLSRKGTPEALHLFRSHKAKENPSKYNYSLFDVIRATAAAQTYFKPHQINGEYFVDGGTICNSPTLVAYEEGIKLGYKDISILSIACGRKNTPFDVSDFDGGMLEWAEPMIDLLLDSQQNMTNYFSEKKGERSEIKYTRLASVIHYSDGTIDNASKSNIKNMVKDGVHSSTTNKLKIQNYINEVSN